MPPVARDQDLGPAAERRPASWAAIAAAPDRFTPAERRNDFIAAGYDPE